MIERIFHVRAAGSSVRTEVLAGVTTFMTMAYIIFVNPNLLGQAGMDVGAVMAATCLASALATFLMGFLANYPIALAPGMGMNAFFTFTICKQMEVPWEAALGMVFLSSALFLVLTFWGVRQAIFHGIPECIKYGTAAGIGLFIAFIGLKDAGIVMTNPATLVDLGDLTSRPVLLALAGLLITVVMMARRVKGAILIGLVATGLLGIPLGIISPTEQGIVRMPTLSPTFLKLDIVGALKVAYIGPIFVFLFFALFDAIGTLVGVGEKAGFIREGEMPRLGRALTTDAGGSLVGSLLGTSTVTAYIESASGVAAGGRTGLANVVTGCLFLVALVFTPVAMMFGHDYVIVHPEFPAPFNVSVLHPVTAPALIVVGSLMMETVLKIKWHDICESIPAFLTIILMPLTFKISVGLAAGFIAYPVLKLITGKGREVHWIVYAIAAAIVVGYGLVAGG